MDDASTGIDHRSLLESLSSRLHASVVVTDAQGAVSWINSHAERAFDGRLPAGAHFMREVDALLVAPPPPDNGAQPSVDAIFGPGELTRRDGSGTCYRLHSFPLSPEADDGTTVHCLVDVTLERRAFANQLAQLASLREISDTLYESLSTEEVVSLILIAVTAHVGFGFNRAFYLEAVGERLRGREGIGPSSPEDAHRIWQSLAHQNLTSIRALYRDATSNKREPDSHTHDLATSLSISLSSEEESRLLRAIAARKPALLHAAEATAEVDRALFETLSTDAVAVVPLYVRHSLAAVLIADNFVTRNAIGDRDLEILKTFSRYAGLALERSQLYDELRQSVQKLQEANETLKTHQRKLLQAEKLSAIGELAACVSHEIRNPLVAIGGLARSLVKDDSLDERQRDTLAMMANQVSRLEKFLRETLDFVKPEVTGAVASDLRDEIRRTIAPLEKELESRSIELGLELGEEALTSVVDPDVFQRAVTNLVLNAMDALEKSGRIHIRARREDHVAVIDVADTGPGIPPDLQPKVFDPFFTTKPEGTGLGLAISAQGIRTLGGQISLQADDPFKTIFRIILPLETNRPRGHGRPEGRRAQELVSS